LYGTFFFPSMLHMIRTTEDWERLVCPDTWCVAVFLAECSHISSACMHFGLRLTCLQGRIQSLSLGGAEPMSSAPPSPPQHPHSSPPSLPCPFPSLPCLPYPSPSSFPPLSTQSPPLPSPSVLSL